MTATRAVVLGAVLLSLSAAGRAFALAPDKRLGQFAVEHWRVKDGLPGDSVVALAQATDGQLWIATLGGLAHYDGIRFTRAASSSDSRLAPLDVRRLLAGADGAVWAGSPYFAPRRFEAGEPAALVPGWPGGLSTMAWAQDARGELWVATGPGLLRISDGRVLEGPRPWQFGDGAPTSASARPPRPTELRFDRAGTAWLGTDRGLYTLAGGRLRRHPGVPAEAAVSVIHEDRRGTVWVAAGDLLYGFDGERSRSFGPAQGLPAGAIAALADDEDGNLWLGTAGRPRAPARGAVPAVRRSRRPARQGRDRGAGRSRGQPVGGHAQRRPQPVHRAARWTPPACPRRSATARSPA